ncbi:tetraspanin-4-like [Pecten maximus]|uniref:tetraspanin-4-like n=1 Tax=Pecten maximus TaxID=6579 RepID=UPI0014589B62|nr:tetraspanin-4-like [Pecten maximus]
MLNTKVPHFALKEKAKLFKRLMLAFLFVYLLEGLASLSIGIWLIVRLRVVIDCFVNYQIHVASVLVLVSGVLNICVCSLGALSSSKAKNTPTLRPFAIFFVLLIALELSAAIVSTVDKHKLDDKTFRNSMTSTHWLISNEKEEDDQKERLECWTEMQKEFRCCGIDGYRDWISDSSDTYNFSETISTTALDSCKCESDWRRKERKCIDVNVTLATDVRSYSLFVSPCYDTLYNAINTHTTLLKWYCPILAIVQIVSFSFIFGLISKIQKANAIAIYGVDNKNNTTESEPPNFSVTDDRRNST